MRRFTSYGPINRKLHYYMPRESLVEKAYANLIGEIPTEGGHYFTVWAPRQTGKTWIMQEAVQKIKASGEYEIGILSMERAKNEKNEKKFLNILIKKLNTAFDKSLPFIEQISDIPDLFTRHYFQAPVIVILDEFDALNEEFINRLVSICRDIYLSRSNELNKPSREKTYLLHSLAFIGVRSVLGIENEKGSPFNIQRSVRIPNLTYDEVKGIFQWYEKESGQTIEPEVIDRLFYETNGQPGITCWFGELLTETYNRDKTSPITMKEFKYTYANAANVLPNNNILNLISKVKKEPYRETAIELFKTDEKIEFSFDNEDLNYLYMNGVIDYESVENESGELEPYCKFANPFVQTRLFNYLSRKMFDYMGQLIHPLDTMEDAISTDSLQIRNILERYQAYLDKNKEIFFKDVPRRKKDLKIYEAIYHFNLYRYLYNLLKKRGVDVIPEFPTGNGKIDLILKYKGGIYALELKSFSDIYDFREGIEQAEEYGRKLGLKEIVYVVFAELKTEEIKKLAQDIEKPGIRVIVFPIGVL